MSKETTPLEMVENFCILDILNPFCAVDHYKVSHRKMYPRGLKKVYSNFTPRSTRRFLGAESRRYDNKIVVAGLTGFSKWFLIDQWNRNFFLLTEEEVVAKYKHRYGNSLGPESVDDLDHVLNLHRLGYLPIRIKAINEGSRVNIKVPVLTVTNTDERFAWLVNYLETVFSSDLWKSMTSATIAYEYHRIGKEYAEATGAPFDFLKFQFHDFSARGTSGFIDSATTGFGHLCVFAGTDTVSAIDYAEGVYNADASKEIIGVSVPTSEHSAASSNILVIEHKILREGELTGEAARREAERRFMIHMMKDLYPSGPVSYVADTYDYWDVVTDLVPSLKPEIMSRNGTFVIRPDSGDPVRIVAGYSTSEIFDVVSEVAFNIIFERYKIGEEGEFKFVKFNGVYYGKNKVVTPEHIIKGTISCLWDSFGGTINEKGYKDLDSHIRLIYGDSITLARAEDIFVRLAAKGFASNNVIFGVGSYTYRYVSRDTFGFAMKATYCEVDDEDLGEIKVELFKDPMTDAAKKSAKGLLRVEKVGEDFILKDCVTPEEEEGGELEVMFENGRIIRDTSLSEIRSRLGVSCRANHIP